MPKINIVLEIYSKASADRTFKKVLFHLYTANSMSSSSVRPMLRDVTNAITERPSLAPKRSLFNKPNWAAKRTSVTKAETDFFDHRDTYSGILAEKEKRREKYRAKASTKAKDRQGPEPKRRRLSEDEDSGLGPESSDWEEETRAVNAQHDGPITRSTPTKKGRTVLGSPNDKVKRHSPVDSSKVPSTKTVELEDDEDETHDTPAVFAESNKASLIKPRPKPPSSDPESEDEDEYTLELKRKARDKVRLQKLGLNASKALSPEPRTAKSQSPLLRSLSQSERVKSPSEIPLQEPPRAPPTLATEDGAIVRILIRTAISDTTELIVNCKVSQSMQLVKEAWCKRQGFDATMTRKVFLTWRGNKLFNATTLTHVLKTLKVEKTRSRVGGIGSNDDEDSDPSKGKIEVEAVTEDILTERKRLKDMEDQRADTFNGDGEGLGEEAGEPQSPKEPDVQLMLNSPGLEPVLLRVRPNTLVGKVMAGFKKIRQIEQGKICWLIFDGERLDPDTRICDTEIEDGDAVDVQIR